MNTNATIPCPVCEKPINVRYLRSPEGEVTTVYTDPFHSNAEIFSFHQHQMLDVYSQSLH